MKTDAAMDERIKLLQVNVAGQPSGQLLQQSGFEFRYLQTDPAQPVVGLLMPPTRLTWQDGALFPVMDQNLPEGDLFNRLRQQFPKQAMTAMRLLALIGDNGIGRLGYRVPGGLTPAQAVPITRQTLLRTPFTAQVFDELVSAYIATGIDVAGIQPKIMVPDRATIPIPNLIVKTAGAGYPGLAANEYPARRWQRLAHSRRTTGTAAPGVGKRNPLCTMKSASRMPSLTCRHAVGKWKKSPGFWRWPSASSRSGYWRWVPAPAASRKGSEHETCHTPEAVREKSHNTLTIIWAS